MARKVCPNCVEFIDKNASVCPNCGHVFAENSGKVTEKDLDNLDEAQNVDLKNVSSDGETKPDDAILNNEISKPKRHAHKKKNKDLPQVKKDENGEYEINTSDVTFFEGASENYSIKKARGEGEKAPKPKWWEIYKWVDIYLARRKIKKEVKKAGVVEPPYVKHGVMIGLCLFFGWMGAHNFYAKNYKKGLFILISFLISCIVVAVSPFNGAIDLSVGGGLGFVVVACWVWDFINILLFKYVYRESRLKFIAKLNLATRKKLGEKYERINEWFVPYETRKNLKGMKRAKR